MATQIMHTTEIPPGGLCHRQWSRANKLQHNLFKTKEIVLRRPTVNLDILPVKLCDIERLDCVK